MISVVCVKHTLTCILNKTIQHIGSFFVKKVESALSHEIAAHEYYANTRDMSYIYYAF